MARLLWLPDVLRAAGVPVKVWPGAQTRGRADIVVNGVVWHHTATGTNWTDDRVVALLRDGRADLKGPLSQAGLARDGTWHLVALGRCNHNGYGLWGNDSIGVEMFNAGDGKDPWPGAQIDSAVLGTRAILAHLGQGPAHLKAHRETDPKRKPDPVGVDMDLARSRVANQEDDMNADQDARLLELFQLLGTGGPLNQAIARIDTNASIAAGKVPPKESLQALSDKDIEAIAEAVNDEAAERLKG